MASPNSDLLTLAAGAVGWALAVPAVKIAGSSIALGNSEGKKTSSIVLVLFDLGLAYVTTPILAKALGWKTKDEKVRGVALALGAAQVIDGLTHLFNPTFYSANQTAGLASAGSIFLGAGLLGIFSAYQ